MVTTYPLQEQISLECNFREDFGKQSNQKLEKREMLKLQILRRSNYARSLNYVVSFDSCLELICLFLYCI